MQQLFFISPTGYAAVDKALRPEGKLNLSKFGFHCYSEDGDESQVIGVVEIKNGDPEQIIDALEAQGIIWLPNHLGTQTICADACAALSEYGVQSTHTTAQAMTLVHQDCGFPPLQPKAKRF